MLPAKACTADAPRFFSLNSTSLSRDAVQASASAECREFCELRWHGRGAAVFCRMQLIQLRPRHATNKKIGRTQTGTGRRSPATEIQASAPRSCALSAVLVHERAGAARAPRATARRHFLMKEFSLRLTLFFGMPLSMRGRLLSRKAPYRCSQCRWAPR